MKNTNICRQKKIDRKDSTVKNIVGRLRMQKLKWRVRFTVEKGKTKESFISLFFSNLFFLYVD